MSELVGFLEDSKGKEIYKLRSAIKKYEESPEYIFESMAIEFATKGSYDYGISSYFKPFYVFGEIIVPKLEDVSLEAIQYWIRRAESTENFVLNLDMQI